MSDAHQHLGPLPGGSSLQVHGAVFGDDEEDLGPGGGHDLAVEVRQDIAVPVSFPVRVGGRQAKEGLAAGCFVSFTQEGSAASPSSKIMA